MPPVRIVEGRDVVMDRSLRFVFRRPGATMNELGLEGCEEALRHRVVPAVADAAHAADDATSGQLRAIHVAGVLASAVGVMNESSLRLAYPQSHPERVERELGAK